MKVGLCRGRHNLPVEGYIFGEVVDVHDFTSMQEIADKYVRENCNVREIMDDDGESRYVGGSLEVYVTGLTALTAAVMAACMWYGVSLTLYHFDRDSGEYIPQNFAEWRKNDRYYRL